MTSKQRAYLKSLASVIDPVLQIGKSSLTPEYIEAVREAFNTRELLKINVLKNCLDDPKEMADYVYSVVEKTRLLMIATLSEPKIR